MELDGLEPAFLIQKGLTLRFVFAYSDAEFRDSLAMICENPDRLAPLVTAQVDLEGINGAFDALTGGRAIKALVRPTAIGL